MKKTSVLITLFTFASMLLPGCKATVTGRIYFDLEGGSFSDPSFSTMMLSGEAGTPVKIDIPNPVKEGYYFVGWREKSNNGYRDISRKLGDDGKFYYYYPYGNDTFYAYFEPLVTLSFDLGIGSEGKIVAPVLGSENFSNNKLNGYASKHIPSTDYLPTVDTSGLHLTFQYWYTEYPLVSRLDEKNTSHYTLDTSSQLGQYRFDRQFTDSMQFLIDSDVTLYASYELDPTVTVHTNIPGVEDYTFKAKNTAEKELTAMMKELFNINYAVASSNYHYTKGDTKYRFGGFYLDEDFNSPFGIQSPISTSDFDLYLKWDNRVVVTLDFNGGKFEGKSSLVLDKEYYAGDLLPSDLCEVYAPTKEGATFKGYTLNGASFSPLRTRLPKEDVTLFADYENYPILSLKYSYPQGFSKDKLSDITLSIPVGEKLTTTLNEFKLAVSDEELVATNFYVLDSENKEIDFIDTQMPDEDLNVYLKLNYKPLLKIVSYTNETTAYTLNSNIDSIEQYLENSVELKDLVGVEDDADVGSDTYFYEGIYFDTALTKETIFPLYEASSHVEKKTILLYRKMTKGITLTFVNEDNSHIGTLKVLPGGKFSRFKSRIDALLGSYTSLEIDSSPLGSTLPKVDSTVVVKR